MLVAGWVLSLVTVAFVMSITPGPNNVLLTASGAGVGFVRTVPAMLGVLAGFVGEIALCIAGAGALLFRHESARIALTVLASGYMLWLAVRLWRAPVGAASAAAGDLAPSLWRFAVLQFVNPKSWLATLAFVAGFLGPRNPLGPPHPLGLLGDLLAVAVFLGVISVSMCVWTVFGAALRARLQPRHWHRVNRTLAVLAAATSITFWL